MSTFNIPVPTCRNMALEMVRVAKLYLNVQFDQAAEEASPPRTIVMQPRMIQAVMKLCTGKSNKQIAHEMNLSTHTIRNYVTDAMRLARANNRTELTYLMMNGRLNLIGSTVPVGRPAADLDCKPGGQITVEGLLALKRELQEAIAQLDGDAA